MLGLFFNINATILMDTVKREASRYDGFYGPDRLVFRKSQTIRY
ncbi:hypothetical protein P9853_28 [Streptococcus phage P9853]|uniref:Uncharacterized protein n=1 Tax=Streptococcus phage P9853 TaxID=1971445 RepID=A0A286QSD5_9CAUD|nr:hypothetical protein PQF06_gp28 [Streptococcus phage P9853]ARU14628.1 hypothetical protein P9853_28 [Streptococcus phage P9853]